MLLVNCIGCTLTNIGFQQWQTVDEDEFMSARYLLEPEVGFICDSRDSDDRQHNDTTGSVSSPSLPTKTCVKKAYESLGRRPLRALQTSNA